MSEGYGVLVGEIRAHAARLDTLHRQLVTAFEAANHVHLGTAAYGQICQFFVPIVQAVSRPGVEAISQAADTMSATAGGVRDTASSYEGFDQAAGRTFGGVR
ncbi:MAG TPA: type VII secretion target [Actinophytocola sp.]|uniref:type VII secretion target n=1 Tax=Actinophytocola sp. TaxID=1872138 RepID=UPI002DB64AF4|nr:type VII secretion target [Actinophytocola sp.]HEU5474958.1 type VII secretion target [Actinophytocola sp.]